MQIDLHMNFDTRRLFLSHLHLFEGPKFKGSIYKHDFVTSRFWSQLWSSKVKCGNMKSPAHRRDFLVKYKIFCILQLNLSGFSEAGDVLLRSD